MKLTTRGNYAIAAMLYLAVNEEKKHIALREIATQLDLSENYLRQLFMELRQQNLVCSLRGVGGGYYLSLDPLDISVLSIVEAVEGQVFVVPCLDDECSDECNRQQKCSARIIWDKLNVSIKDKLSKLSLQELINEYAE
jgi:Rrf2 family iron-sulfur cluster assembly transcriptional regulator